MDTIFEVGKPNAEDMSFVADALLALCADDHESPFLTEDGFEAKLNRSWRKELASPREVPSSEDDPMMPIEYGDIMGKAKLTSRQRDILGLRLEGFSFEEIGLKRHISKQGAKSVFIQALRKFARTFRAYPYAGLSEVYQSEVKRRSRGRSFGTMVR